MIVLPKRRSDPLALNFVGHCYRCRFARFKLLADGDEGERKIGICVRQKSMRDHRTPCTCRLKTGRERCLLSLVHCHLELQKLRERGANSGFSIGCREKEIDLFLFVDHQLSENIH